MLQRRDQRQTRFFSLNKAGRHKSEGGFTLVELLVIIGIIIILFSVILIAVDPARRFKQAREAVRHEDVRDIVEAVLEYMVDNVGTYPSGIDSDDATFQVLGTAPGTGCAGTIGANCSAVKVKDTCLDLSGDLVDRYLAEIPKDPLTGTDSITDYYLNKTGTGRIEVGACDPELESEIKYKR